MSGHITVGRLRVSAGCAFPLTGVTTIASGSASSITIPYPPGSPGDFLVAQVTWSSWNGALYANAPWGGGSNSGNFGFFGHVRGAESSATFRLPTSTFETGGPPVPSASEVIVILANVVDVYGGDPGYVFDGQRPLLDFSVGAPFSDPADVAYTTDGNLALLCALSSVTSGSPGMSITGGAVEQGAQDEHKRRLDLVSLPPNTSGTYRFNASGAGAQVEQTRIIVLATCTGWPFASPANDHFVDAIDLGSGTSGTSARISNRYATTEASEPIPTNGPGDGPHRSLWWKWTCPGGFAGSVSFDTFGSDPTDPVGDDIDTVIAAYTGASLAGLTEIASNDDHAGGPSSTMSQITFTPTPGTVYWIQASVYRAEEVAGIKVGWA